MSTKNTKNNMKIDSLATNNYGRQTSTSFPTFIFIFYINVFLIFLGIWSSGTSEWVWLFMTYIFLAMVYKFTIIYCSKIGQTCGIANAMDQSWLGKSTYFLLISEDRRSFREMLIAFYLNLSGFVLTSFHKMTWFGSNQIVSVEGIS